MPISYECWYWYDNNNMDDDNYYYLPIYDGKGFYLIIKNFFTYCRQVYKTLAIHKDFVGGICRLRQLPGLLLLGYDAENKMKGIVSFSFFTHDLPCSWVIPTSRSSFSEMVTNPGWRATTMLKPKIQPVMNLPFLNLSSSPMIIFNLPNSSLVVAYRWSSILFLLLQPIFVIPCSQLKFKILNGNWDPHQLINKSKNYIRDETTTLKTLGSHYIVQYFPKSHLNENIFSIAVYSSNIFKNTHQRQHHTFLPSDFMKSLVWGISLLHLSQERI
ncbi:hypothetical protein TCON_1728 [Astathelohania contejeani]|uniref:Uncharacterized protein n=1 Tax=Astathelohania contejeani TaxID=164912 RepID=A0ABQ7HXZ8_9MICR|nr:hypothetical protein TCON_1728 [Thelohania contejeani]